MTEWGIYLCLQWDVEHHQISQLLIPLYEQLHAKYKDKKVLVIYDTSRPEYRRTNRGRPLSLEEIKKAIEEDIQVAA